MGAGYKNPNHQRKAQTLNSSDSDSSENDQNDQNYHNDDQWDENPKDVQEKGATSNKKCIIITAVLLLLAGGGAAAFFLLKKDAEVDEKKVVEPVKPQNPFTFKAVEAADDDVDDIDDGIPDAFSEDFAPQVPQPVPQVPQPIPQVPQPIPQVVQPDSSIDFTGGVTPMPQPDLRQQEARKAKKNAMKKKLLKNKKVKELMKKMKAARKNPNAAAAAFARQQMAKWSTKRPQQGQQQQRYYPQPPTTVKRMPVNGFKSPPVDPHFEYVRLESAAVGFGVEKGGMFSNGDIDVKKYDMKKGTILKFKRDRATGMFLSKKQLQEVNNGAGWAHTFRLFPEQVAIYHSNKKDQWMVNNERKKMSLKCSLQDILNMFAPARKCCLEYQIKTKDSTKLCICVRNSSQNFFGLPSQQYYCQPQRKQIVIYKPQQNGSMDKQW